MAKSLRGFRQRLLEIVSRRKILIWVYSGDVLLKIVNNTCTVTWIAVAPVVVVSGDVEQLGI